MCYALVRRDNLIFKLPNVGINSNTVLFRNKASQGNPDENLADPEAGAFANKVLEYNRRHHNI